MQKFIIKGPNKAVKGEVEISGAKNSCLPLMAASILFKKKVILRNVPFVKDVQTMKNLLISLGAKVDFSEKKKIITIENKKNHSLVVPYNLVSTMRAGVLLMGPLLAKYSQKKIKVALGGGCALGVRDTNWHLAGFRSLSARNNLEKGYEEFKSLVKKKVKFLNDNNIFIKNSSSKVLETTNKLNFKDLIIKNIIRSIFTILSFFLIISFVFLLIVNTVKKNEIKGGRQFWKNFENELEKLSNKEIDKTSQDKILNSIQKLGERYKPFLDEIRKITD